MTRTFTCSDCGQHYSTAQTHVGGRPIDKWWAARGRRCSQCLAAAQRFDGADYQHGRDQPRLSGQIRRVWDVMADGQWRTLDQIAQATGDPHASISAQLRHLRKPRFGAHTVDRRHIRNGLYEYRLIVNDPSGLRELQL